MFFDPLYLIIMLTCLALSAVTSLRVKAAFAQGKKTAVSSGVTGAEAAARILKANGIFDVKIIEGKGFLTDHYNPATKNLVLSPDVYRGSSAASVGVAAHEVGHAVQHASGYRWLGLRTALVPVVNIGSNIGLWLVIIGIILGSAYQASSGNLSIGYYLALVGVILYSATFVFSVVTVPVEIDASRRAVRELEADGITRSAEETEAVRKVLSAAALTYVAAAIGSLLQLAYWVLRSGILNRRD